MQRSKATAQLAVDSGQNGLIQLIDELSSNGYASALLASCHGFFNGEISRTPFPFHAIQRTLSTPLQPHISMATPVHHLINIFTGTTCASLLHRHTTPEHAFCTTLSHDSQ
jgi:hypothetical protein